MNLEAKHLRKKIEIKEIKDEISDLKDRMNADLKRKHPYMFRSMDILVVIIILMNFGALVMTNALVVRQTPPEDRIFYEGNPVAVEVHDFTPVPQELKGERNKLLFDFILRGGVWAFLLLIYILYRETLTAKNQLYLMLFVVFIYFFILGSDFFNNLGLWIGKGL